jgi:adenylate kinase family enzyme
MLQIKNLGEQQKEGNTTINLLVYGDPGVGKTTFAATAAELGKVLYIDAESGAKFIDKKYADKIDILHLADVSVLDEVLKPANIAEYKTIVIDSITEVMKKLLDRIKGSKDKPTIADWGTVINQMESFFRKFRDLDKHVIMCALSSEKGDEDVVLKRPSLSGKNLPADIVGIVDICLYMENNQLGRVAYTQASQKYYAKDRTNTLPDKIVNEDLNVKFLVDLATTTPSKATEDQLETIYGAIMTLGYDDTTVAKMASYGGANTLAELGQKGADKVIKALEVKLSLIPKVEQKVEPTPEPATQLTTEDGTPVSF